MALYGNGNENEKLPDKLASQDPREDSCCSPGCSVQGSTTRSDHLEDEYSDNQEKPHKVLLRIDAVVKGYHECPFAVYEQERFKTSRKRGQRGNALRVYSHRLLIDGSYSHRFLIDKRSQICSSSISHRFPNLID